MNQEAQQEQRDRRERDREERVRTRETLQRHLPRIRIDDEVWTTTSTEDKRSVKRYTRTCRVGVTVYIRDWQTSERLNDTIGRGYHTDETEATSYWGYVHRAVKAAFADEPWPCPTAIHYEGRRDACGKHREAGWDYCCTFYVQATHRAPKPSKIPSEDELLSQFGGAKTIGEHLYAAIEQGVDQANEAVTATDRARVACLILSDYVQRVDFATKAAVRYRQRLAALNAEYEVEREVQCAQLLDKVGDKCDVIWEDAPNFEPDPRSTAAAKAKLPERVARLEAPSRRGRGLPDCTRELHDIKIDDVE